MKKTTIAFIGTLIAFSTAHADLVNFVCEPVFMKNALSITGAVLSETLEDGTSKNTISFAGTTKRTGNGGSGTVAVAGLNGHIVQSNGLPDAQGNTPKYSTFYGTMNDGSVKRVQIAVGDYAGNNANSFVQMADGVYYHANCQRAVQK